MFRLNYKTRGQSTLEYALLVFTVVAGLLVTQSVVKRGFQGRLHSAAEDMGEPYSPGHSPARVTTIVSAESNEKVENKVTTSTIKHQSQARSGYESVEELENELYPPFTK